MAYDRYGKYKNKFKIGDTICIIQSLGFNYWSLPLEGTFEVIATVSWNQIRIRNVHTNEFYPHMYNVKNFKHKVIMAPQFDKGDIVIPSLDGRSGWSGTRADSLQRDQSYIVTDVIEDNVSGKVKYRVDKAVKPNVDGIWKATGGHYYKGTWYLERHFKIKEKGNLVTVNNANVKAIILNERGETVGTIATHDAACNILVDEKDIKDAINKKVGELLRKTPSGIFRVFEYTKTGKLPELTPIWE